MTDVNFKSWAVVEVMGHVEYAGYVSAETIAGQAMLRIDVPQNSKYEAFTKYIAPNALYAISPCSEETARARAETQRATPISVWSLEGEMMKRLREKGLLIEQRQNLEGEDSDGDDF